MNDEVAGRTPLHYAADYGQEEVMLYLISKGANVNVAKKSYYISIEGSKLKFTVLFI